MIAAAPIATSIFNLQLSPGSRVTIENVDWDDYELLLLEMGDRSCDQIGRASCRERVLMPV